MIQLVFATHNPNKLKEVRQIFSKEPIEIVSLTELKFHDEIEETESTLEGNARLKSRAIFEKFGLNVCSDDTGLEVIELGNEPGVYSARYAGKPYNSERNMDLLLEKLSTSEDRRAQFRTAISLIWEGEEFLFEGEVQGHIATQRMGDQGFGYDPIFIPLGHERSFAQFSAEEKNSISHRGRAFEKMYQFICSKLN